MDVPDELRYSDDHEWLRPDGEQGLVGITRYAADELGDVVFVELPAVGRTLSRGETFGVIESVKTASDLYSPVSGEVIEVNDAARGCTPAGQRGALRRRLAHPAAPRGPVRVGAASATPTGTAPSSAADDAHGVPIAHGR